MHQFHCLTHISKAQFSLQSPSHVLTMYNYKSRPFLEYCSYFWVCAPKFTLCLLDKVQSKAIRLINRPTKFLQPVSHCRFVGDLSIFYIFFPGHFSQELWDILYAPRRCAGATRGLNHAHPFHHFRRKRNKLKLTSY